RNTSAESRRADDGGCAHSDFHRGGDAAVGRLDQPLRLGGAPGHLRFWLDRLGRRLQESGESRPGRHVVAAQVLLSGHHWRGGFGLPEDRKSTRLNSSHVKISYAVFCLKKKIKCPC